MLQPDEDVSEAAPRGLRCCLQPHWEMASQPVYTDSSAQRRFGGSGTTCNKES